MNNRIKELRKYYGLTQDEFGSRIGIKKAAISMIESGKSNPSAQTITIICEKFGVNETWLRTGEGEMFVPKAEDELEAIVAKHGLSPQFATVLRNLLELPTETQDAIVQFVLDTAQTLLKDQNEGSTQD